MATGNWSWIGAAGTLLAICLPAPEVAVSQETGAAKKLVDAHNELRAKHCAPPLKWSPEVAAIAEEWAEKLQRRRCKLGHSGRSGFGENLAYQSPPGTMDPAGVVGYWYGEIRDYNFKRPGFGLKTGHFTQVVWAGSVELGCAQAVCGDKEIWICNYSPAGNVAGQFPDNVLPTSCTAD